MLKKVWAWLGKAVRPKAGQTPNLFAASSAVLGVAAVYLYFAGYIFCYAFYNRGFGVTLESLDLSPQFYFVRSYTVLATVRGTLVMAVLVVMITAYAGGALRRGLMVLALAAAFPALFYVSTTIGERESGKVQCHAVNTVQFQFNDGDKKEKEGDKKGKAKGEDKEAAVAETPAATDDDADSDTVTRATLMKLSRGGELSLLLETKDRIVVYKISQCSGPLGAPDKQVYTLLRDDLDFVSVLTSY